MLNKALLLGRVGKKDHKQIKNGSFMTVLSIATSRKYIDSSGNKREETTWHTVNFFNKIADIANKYAHVGDLIYIEGEISHREIESKEGVKKWMYSITGNELKLIPRGQKAPADAPIGNAKNDFIEDECPF